MSLWKGNITEAVALRHTQGTDAGLDTGGGNAITAAELAYAKVMDQGVAVGDDVEFNSVRLDNDDIIYLGKGGFGGAGGFNLGKILWDATDFFGLGITVPYFTDATCDTHTNTTITMSDTSLVGADMGVSGVDIPAGARVVSVDSATSITISVAATGTSSGLTLTFQSSFYMACPDFNWWFGYNGVQGRFEFGLSTNRAQISLTGTIFNSNSNDANFVIKGDTDPNCFTVDGGLDRVGIGIALNSHAGKLHIDQDSNSAAIPVLVLDQADESEGFINFIGSDRGVIAGATASTESVRVEIGGAVKRLALYADA